MKENSFHAVKKTTQTRFVLLVLFFFVITPQQNQLRTAPPLPSPQHPSCSVPTSHFIPLKGWSGSRRDQRGADEGGGKWGGGGEPSCSGHGLLLVDGGANEGPADGLDVLFSFPSARARWPTHSLKPTRRRAHTCA